MYYWPDTILIFHRDASIKKSTRKQKPLQEFTTELLI